MAASTTTSVDHAQEELDARLDVSVLKELARKSLVDSLNAIGGAKTLVLDPSIAGPLGLVTEVALLKQHGVDKMFWLESGPISSTTANIVYLCRPIIKHAKIIAEQIKRHAKDSQRHLYTLLCVPRVSTLVTRILEEEGVLGDVTLSSYNLQFIPLADDVISLEYDEAFKEIWVDGDETAIFDSAQALLTLQKIYGLFPRIVGKGDHAARLTKLLTRGVQQATGSLQDTLTASSEQIDSLIVLDRRADLITPLLTQLTYEGLIDEVVGIKNAHILIPASFLVASNQPGQPNNATSPQASTTPLPTVSVSKDQKKKYKLSTDTDPLIGELRDLNFSAVGKKLSKTAHRLNEDYNVRHQAKTPAQLRDFVGKLGGLQSEHRALKLHTDLSEMLVPYTRSQEFGQSLEIQQNLLASYELPAQITAIEDMIAQGADMQMVLRLLCLASITGGGIKAKPLENIKREFLQAYGYHHLPLLLALSATPLSAVLTNPLPAGVPASTVVHAKYPFSQIRKQLRLLIDAEGLDELENDISYVYSGYAPLSIRLVQCIAQKGGVLSNPAEISDAKPNPDGEAKSSNKVQAHPIVGWKGFDDTVATIPGETIDVLQKTGADTKISAIMQPHQRNTTTVVFFLGGCTYTEIAALRWVARQNRGRQFLIATTGIVSGRSLIESMAGTSATPGSKDAGL